MNELAPFESFLKELIAAYRTKYAVQFNKNFPVEGKNAVREHQKIKLKVYCKYIF
ncbi:hypothetical protein NOX58_003700 [Acinetobacter baumannii]|nr:hypothetical protein [Acinetobacter baumannii]